MHILIIPSSYPTFHNPIKGIFFREQAHALRRAGLQVGVMAPYFRSLRHLKKSLVNWPRRFISKEDEGIPTYRYYFWSWSTQFFEIYRHFRTSIGQRLYQEYVKQWGKPDIIHAHVAYHGGDLAATFKRVYGVSYVLTEHSTAYSRDILNNQRIVCAKRAFLEADARIVVSPELGRLLEKKLGTTVVSPWIWVPNVVDRMFSPLYKGSHSEIFKFLNVALMTKKKGQEDLLRAFAKQFKGNKNVQLRFGGDGAERAPLEQLAVSLGVREQVIFLGMLEREQVVSEMQMCDTFVLSSHYETFGVVLIEALACGKPVIATACGGPESIVNTKNGLLVPPQNIEELGRALVQMYQNKHNYNAEGIYRDCISHFGEEAVVQQLKQLYSSILQGKA